MRRLVPRATVTLALLCASSAAFAGRMPQLNFGDPLLLAQVVWGAIIFGVLYYGVSTSGLPRVAEILEAREQKIGGDLQAARLTKEKADRAVAELADARRLAYAEAQAALATATQRAKDEAAARAAELNARLTAQLAEAEKNIAAARNAALAALHGAASDTAADLISRLAGRPADQQALSRAIGAELSARGLAGA
jgi:F-type H+-transporting ATPase subunit b